MVCMGAGRTLCSSLCGAGWLVCVNTCFGGGGMQHNAAHNLLKE